VPVILGDIKAQIISLDFDAMMAKLADPPRNHRSARRNPTRTIRLVEAGKIIPGSINRHFTLTACDAYRAIKTGPLREDRRRCRSARSHRK